MYRMAAAHSSILNGNILPELNDITNIRYGNITLFKTIEINVQGRSSKYITSMLLKIRGRVDDLSFFDYLSPFYFLLIEFHCTFFISCKMVPYYVY